MHTYTHIYIVPKIMKWTGSTGTGWKHIGRGFSWRLNIDTLFVEQLCTSRECQVDPVETEKAREETVA